MVKTVARLAIKDLKTCLKIYYTYPEIGSKEIKELFGVGNNKVCELKDSVRKEQVAKGVMVLDKYSVNTETAFKVWGIDIEDIENRVKKLEKLGLYREAVV